VWFLKLVGTAVPDGLELHLIRGNYAPQDPGDQEVAAAPGSTCTSPQAEQAADWEFTYISNGVTVQVLNRNILANARHAYALCWSTPASDWNACYHFFQVFPATFRPAPASQPG
jgi:hypothetical protein